MPDAPAEEPEFIVPGALQLLIRQSGGPPPLLVDDVEPVEEVEEVEPVEEVDEVELVEDELEPPEEEVLDDELDDGGGLTVIVTLSLPEPPGPVHVMV